MRIAEINMMHFGSTGKIMLSIAECARDSGNEVATFSARFYHRGVNTVFPVIHHHTYFGNRIENMIHLRLAQMTGFHGCFSALGTLKLLKMLDRFHPDVIHLHNLHNWSINFPLLMNYIKKRNVPVVWTLHDCWAFTGHCPYYGMVECDRWKTGCHSCPIYREYPQSFVDNSRYMWKHKKKWFTGLQNVTIVTPSRWLAEQVKQSFLKDYSVKVINNGIDLAVFRRTESDFRKKYGCIDKKIVLGVAFGWGKRKGLDVFAALSNRLTEDYQIVLVGTEDKLDNQLPENIISIHRTQNQRELAEIYSAADVFVNPTREETFGLVNVEALACGVPVVTFDTGGSPECIDESCGIVVPRDDVDALESAVRQVCEQNPFTCEACVARAKCFDQHERFQDYVNLYDQIG